MESLEALLHEAARAADWQQSVVHRCAWCGHIANRGRGRAIRAAAPVRVTTDGMCDACGRKALAELALRAARRRRELRRAA